jgi:hypothetical protein
MTHAELHADNAFAVVWRGTDGASGHVVANQPKSFDWQAHRAKQSWSQKSEQPDKWRLCFL